MKNKKIDATPEFLARLKKESAEGKEIKVKWEGGNDSGSFYVSIDDEELDWENQFSEFLTDIVAEELGYGSFAGDYSANGEVVYNPEDNTLVGTDSYSQDEYADVSLKGNEIVVKVPKDLWFDRLLIEIDRHFCYEDLTPSDISVNFEIMNGPIVEEHDAAEEIIASDIFEYIDSTTFHELLLKQVDYIRHINNELTLEFNEFEVEGEYRIYKIDYINYCYEKSEDKDIVIHL